MLGQFLESEMRRAGPSVVCCVPNETGANRVVQQVAHNCPRVVALTQHTVVESGLPQWNVHVAPPRVPHYLLPYTNRFAKVCLIARPFEEQMHVVRHKAVRRYGKFAAREERRNLEHHIGREVGVRKGR